MSYQQFTNQPLPPNRQNYPQLQKYPYSPTPSVNVRPQLATHFQPPAQCYTNPQIYPQYHPAYQHQPNAFVSVQTYPHQVSNEYYQAPMQLSYAPMRHQLPQNHIAAFEIEEQSSKENFETKLHSDSTDSLRLHAESKPTTSFSALSCASTFMSVVYAILALLQLFGNSTFRVDLYTDFEPRIQQAIRLTIFVLIALKVPVFVSGNLAVKNKSFGMIGIFISALIAHILFVTLTLFAAATFYPWIFRGVVMIYIMASFLEAMWFLPSAFAYKAYLETLRANNMTASVVPI